RDGHVTGVQTCALPILNAGLALKIKIDPRMQATLTQVAIECAVVLIFIQQSLEGAQIFPHPLGRYGGVFPTFPGIRLTRNARGEIGRASCRERVWVEVA